MLYLNGFGTPLIVLGTHQAAIDLLEKRSTIYSDRNLADMADLWVVFLAYQVVATDYCSHTSGRVLIGFSP